MESLSTVPPQALYGYNTSFTWRHCYEMEEVAESVLLRCVLIAHTLCSILAIPLLIFFFRWVIWQPLMHYNTKVILVFNVICLAIHLMSRIHQHVAKLCDMFGEHDNGCQIIPSVVYCFYIRLPYNCALWLCYTTTIMISIERWIATINIHNKRRSRRIGPALVAAQFLVSCSLLLIIYIPTKFSGKIMYYCLAMSATDSLYTVAPLSIIMIIQTFGILLFIKLKMTNREIRRKLRKAGDFSGRYQVEITLRSLNTLSPFFYSTYAFIFTYLTLMCLTMAISSHLDTPLFLALIEGTNWMPQYCMFLPLLLWYRGRIIRNRVKSQLSNEIATTTERYEEELRKMWT